jgi:alpha-glucosidase
LRIGRGFSPDNPYAFQYHVHNNTQPENLAFLGQLRELLDRYPGATTLGEISSDDSLATMADYVTAGRLHMGYSFELLTDDFTAAYIRDTVRMLETRMPDGWPCWAISNHDVQRAVTRWGASNGNGDHGESFAKLLLALVTSLRGSICLYQGEELGLTEAEVPFEALQDPYGIAFWPSFKGRDGCRTPMPWDDTPNAGFSGNTPWLPLPEAHRTRSVAQQEQSPDSVLHTARRLLRWRKSLPALMRGDICMLDTPEPVLAFERRLDDEVLLAVFNLSPSEQTWALPDGSRAIEKIEDHGLPGGEIEGGRLHLPAHGVFYGRS